MAPADWVIVVAYCACALGIGAYFTKRASRSPEDFFIAGRKLPWWVIGFSNVATYSGSSAAFVMLVFVYGFAGNWFWWASWVVWMPLVAVLWAKLWRRMEVVTTAEMLELRYAGRAAATFRAVLAVYSSFGWAVVLMGYVTGWLARELQPILGWSDISFLLFFGAIALAYTLLAGLFGVAYSDVVQFIVLFIANVALVPILFKAAGGLGAAYTGIEQTRGSEFFASVPPTGDLTLLTVLALGIQGLFFAGSPSAGEGATAQRFLAARNEFHAIVGQLFSTLMSLVVRIVPLILMGVVAAKLYVPADFSEPADVWAKMVLQFAPTGLLGLLVAGEIAGYMSTIDSSMNWGASYLLNDLYRRFVKRDASNQHYVIVSRIASAMMMGTALFVAYFLVKGMTAWFLFINSVMVAFALPLCWLRFFWWRLNIYGEAAGTLGGLPLGYLIWFTLGFKDKPLWQGFFLLFVAGWATILIVTILTRPERTDTLRQFYKKCRPPGWWRPVTEGFPEAERVQIKEETRGDVLDCGIAVVACASLVASVNSLLAGKLEICILSGIVAVVTTYRLIRRWRSRGVFERLTMDR